MKPHHFTLLAAMLLSITLPAAAWAAGGQRGAQRCETLSSETLSQAERDDLIFMREEEKMARDLYLGFHRLYGSRVRLFANIAAAEQTHMNAVKQLLVAYGLPDPVSSNRSGVFTNGLLRDRYNQLLAKGEASLSSAFAVGVTVEEADIEDLAKAIGTSNESCIDRVYLNLLRGSEHHLRAFQRQLQ